MPMLAIAGRWTPDGLPQAAKLSGLDSAWLDQVIARSPIAIAVIDHAGVYRAVNPAYCAMYGYSAELLLSGSFMRIFDPTLHALLLERHQRFLAEGGDLKGEWEVQRQDGVRLSVVSESVRVPGADGQWYRLVYVLDISERKRMEQALQGAHRFLQSVIDTLDSQVCVLDAAGKIIAVNRSWLAFSAAQGGGPAATGLGAHYLQQGRGTLPDDGGPQGFSARLGEVLAGRSAGFEAEFACHSAQEQRWFVARVAAIAGSAPLQVVIAHDNVTALKRAQESVRRREALLNDLAAHVPTVLYRLEVEADGRGRFTYVSPGIEAISGLKPEQVMADRAVMMARIEPDELPAYAASVRTATQALATWSHEYRLRHLDGSVRWVHSMATPVPGADGQVAWSGMLSDISERKAALARLAASEETYRTLFETVPQGVVYHDNAGRVTSANPAALRILGLTLGQLQGRPSLDPAWRAVREDGSDFPGDQHPAMVALATGLPVKDVVMGVQSPGRGQVWIRVSAIPLHKHGRIDGVYASFEDISQQVQLSQELRRQASTDDLTGVANRRSFMARLAIEFQRLQRHAQVRCSLVALDIDWFKRVNDTWGHAAGDAVLRHFARLMDQVTRLGDMVGRTGGEEFMLLLPDTTLDDATGLAQRLVDQVAATPLPWAGGSIVVTISAGVSMLDARDTGVDEVLARADQALYAVKDSGRNAVRAHPQRSNLTPCASGSAPE